MDPTCLVSNLPCINGYCWWCNGVGELVHSTQMASIVNRSQSNRALWMWWNKRFASWTCSWQICSNCV